MTRKTPILLLTLFCLTLFGSLQAQKRDLKDVITRKWKILWYADDGVEKNMEDKKQYLVLRKDGTGTMSMLGEKVGDVTWSIAGRKKIYFSDFESAPPYLVKVTKYKTGKNMLFTGTMPNGVVREIYFQAMSGK
jgi:hypothetical protein